MKSLLRAGALVAPALLALTLIPGAATARSIPAYLDRSAPTPVRVADLVRRMTVEEKVGQTAQPAIVTIQGDCNWSGGQLNTTCMKKMFADQHVGQMLSGGGQAPAQNTPRAWAEMINTIQKYAIDNHRLRIPLLYGVDAVHGHNNVLGATKFPQQLGVGATWNPAISQAMGQATSKAVKATGPNWNFAPVQDIARDTRWGRYYETYSEDPHLAGVLGAAFVKGSQQDRKVAATVKHFAGYSEPFNGHDRANSHLDMRYFQDTFLPSYKAAVDAGAQTLMVNSGAINGVPAHASRYLLTDLLRRQWGFKGVVISDWDDVQALQKAHKVAADYADAAGIAMNAGVDVAMLPPGSVDGYIDGLVAQVKSGKVSRKRLDEAVGRILTLKFQLGLFDNPYVDPAKADAAVLGADKPLAVKAATESMTLLKNDGNVLPLPTGDKVVVTGSGADSVPIQNGGWTIGWQGIPDGVDDPGVTVWEGVKALAGDKAELVKDAGEAVDKTEDADGAIVVVGEKPGAEGVADNETPELAADQQELVDRLQATGKKVTVVVLASRPLVLGKAADAKQLLMAWLPGSEAGTAVADVLYGRANPGGRLPVSWPKSVGDQPMYYQQLPGTNSGPSSAYDPLFPFGHGLSYTTFAVKSLALADRSVSKRGTVKLTLQVSNTGNRDGDMVVPVYAGQPYSRVQVPPNRLATFTRVPLKAGETRSVTLTFPMSNLAVTPGDINGAGTPSAQSGAYQITAGDQSADLSVR
ncbi:glycoside hydrolase family 3 N-terminal domain-containing protein [Actinomadura sp. 6N118]|uniref:glycoside hydrolase family 3 N-terminal domain-containing protein n=1 Tax=Actinomadura sp. 6N118 TaxID=3375151 RepID=UPI00379C6DA7